MFIFSIFHSCAALFYIMLHADVGWHCWNANVCVMFHIPWTSGEAFESPSMGSNFSRYVLIKRVIIMISFHFKCLNNIVRFLWDHSCHHIWSFGRLSWLDARFWAQLPLLVIWSGSCWYSWPLSMCYSFLHWS